ncbi:hypothetical protein [Flavobacterium sp.]|uniref:hypothetical protein n=1 Tax=Flavobacterium sp. TaxID=239 RepID=UPI001B79AF44|nr:hypothetical protein [Flavobacterium sp.]MBP6126593.1 hypothetical protein [Flavobacterium sp.]
MSKTLKVKKEHLRNLVLSFILGFGILYGLEHFGKISYTADTSSQNNYGKLSLVEYVPATTKVLSIYFDSYFGNRIRTDGNGFNLYDLNYSDSDFNKYSNKSYYYTQATIIDYKYGIYISLSLFLISVFFANYKIQLT